MRGPHSDGPVTNDDPLSWLQQWYESQCDGDWEHSYGVTIDTLDNPGWRLTIDLTETTLADKSFEPTEWHRSKQQWLVCRVEGAQFVAFCGPHQLVDAIAAFRRWVESSPDS